MEGIDKLSWDLQGMPVFLHSLKAFLSSPMIGEVILVTQREKVFAYGELCRLFGFTELSIIPGGATRTESALLGLAALGGTDPFVAIHDAARPFVRADLIEESILAAQLYGAAAPGLRVKDTIKQVEDGFVVATPPRETLVAMQTPQVFSLPLIREALGRAQAEGLSFTDDCAAVERLGHRVYVTAGSEDNIKLTTKADLRLCEALCYDKGVMY